MLKKVIRAGNSTAVTVPSDFVKKVGVKIGDSVKVKTSLEKGQVVYTFSGVRQLTIKNNFLEKNQKSPKQL